MIHPVDFIDAAAGGSRQHLETTTMIKPIGPRAIHRLSDGVRQYRGFRAIPCFESMTTGATLSKQTGWLSRDIDCGYQSYRHGRASFFKTLDRFQKMVDDMYAAGNGDYLLRCPERVSDLRAAIARLAVEYPAIAAAAARDLEDKLALAREHARVKDETQAAAQRADDTRKRLHAAAPDLLQALQWALGQIEDDLDPDHQQALAAAHAVVARATGEA